MNFVAKWLALGFGSGLAPVAPGTFGTLAAIPIFVLMQNLPTSTYIGLVLIFSIVGIWACHVYSRALGVHDHGSIVWDEVVGYLITMMFAPQGWQWIVIGFFLFRLFDIWKPWPIRLLDRHVHGGFGIMVDDMLAGVFGMVVIILIKPYVEF
ncbi:MAG: phosphatidylglycerophosphatase A [Gammaproteobacteria bacterium]|nr:phosphatidylglycerophosphatase A [Gammaproteobacteria bacterium]